MENKQAKEIVQSLSSLYPLKDYEEDALKIAIQVLENLEKLFALMYSLDELTVKKDIKGLRKMHYENMDWLKEKGLIDEYFEYYIAQLN